MLHKITILLIGATIGIIVGFLIPERFLLLAVIVGLTFLYLTDPDRAEKRKQREAMIKQLKLDK